MTCSASNANGTTYVTSDWEFKNAGTQYNGGQWTTSNSASSNQGPIGVLQVKVYQ